MRSWIASLCLVGLASPLPLSAQDATSAKGAAASSPRDRLEEKGIRVFTSNLALADETALSRKFREQTKLKKQMRDAAGQLDAVEKQIAQNKQLVTVYTQKRALYRQQYDRTTNVVQQNRLVLAMNELGDRINLLIQNGGMEKELQAARDAAYKARAAYIDFVLELGKQIEQVRKKYTDLAVDPEVQQAIDALNAETGKKYELVESSAFEDSERRYKRLADSVLSDSIDLRAGADSTFYVSTVINKKPPQELAVDSGSSLVSLPHKLAEELGIEMKPTDPTVRLKLADGKTIIDARLVTLDSMRVGRFTVEKVEAAVMPENLADAPAILGMSFLKNFNFKINSETRKLEMTKVDEEPSESEEEDRKRR
ncbi:MAG: retroviral-like aspartic protease family protein [Planctomycetes bacterium]|nr:retroviral-like aspartic protease family protein [Planctomycetota bacterium]